MLTMAIAVEFFDGLLICGMALIYSPDGTNV